MCIEKKLNKLELLLNDLSVKIEELTEENVRLRESLKYLYEYRINGHKLEGNGGCNAG